MSVNERPGVYSAYEGSSTLSGTPGSGIVGVAGRAEAGTAGSCYTVDSYAEGVSAFGGGSNLAELIKILFLNGAASVRAVPAAIGSAPTEAQYVSAFEALMGCDEVKTMTCDSRLASVHAKLQAAIAGGNESSKYRIGIVEAPGAVDALVSAASAISDERMVLCGPVTSEGVPGCVAAAVAGAVASASDPAMPVNGAVLYGLGALSASYSDANISTLVRGGVTPVESVGGEVSVVRGITTRTTTGGEPDATWRELTTIRIVDDVIPSIRAALRSRFTRTKNTAQTRGAIRTQTIIELENKLAREIIDAYGDVTVTASAEDPTICEVGFDFTVAHGLNQIRLTAHITV